MQNKFCFRLLIGTFFSVMLWSCGKINTTIEDSSNLRKIKKSNKIIIDNANRTIRNQADRISESITYFYNQNDLLSQININIDTAENSALLAVFNVNYFNQAIIINNVILYPNVGLVFTHDNQKRIQVIKPLVGKDSINFYYNANNQVNEIKLIDSSGSLAKHHFDFAYDANNNLISYKTKDRNNNNLISTVDLVYYPDYTIRNEFDSRFYREETRIFHLGGLNLIYMIGLNYGNTTKNALKQRTERIPNIAGGTTTIVNTFSYEFNDKNEIIYRYLYGPTDTLKYNFEYED